MDGRVPSLSAHHAVGATAVPPVRVGLLDLPSLSGAGHHEGGAAAVSAVRVVKGA